MAISYCKKKLCFYFREEVKTIQNYVKHTSILWTTPSFLLLSQILSLVVLFLQFKNIFLALNFSLAPKLFPFINFFWQILSTFSLPLKDTYWTIGFIPLSIAQSHILSSIHCNLTSAPIALQRLFLLRSLMMQPNEQSSPYLTSQSCSEY